MTSPNPNPAGTPSQGGGGSSPTTHTENADSPWSGLPEDLRSHPSITRHKSVEDLAREHANVQGLIGRKGVIPPDWKNEQDVERYYGELGRPKTPGEYDLSQVQIPDGLPWDHDFGLYMLNRMHQAGLNGRQVQQVLDAYIQGADSQWGALQQHRTSAMEAAQHQLQEKYGNAYEEQKRRAGVVFARGWGEAAETLRTLELADGTHLGNHPAFIEGLASLAGMMAEHNLLGDKMPPRQTMTPQEAEAELSRLAVDESFQRALFDRGHAEHNAAVAKQHELYIAAGRR